MRQKLVIFLLAGAMALLSAGAGQAETSWAVTEGTQEYRGFALDNVLYSEVCAGQLRRQQSCARLLYPARL